MNDTDRFLKQQLKWEREQLKEAKEFLRSTEGSPYVTCSGSEDLGYRQGRVNLLQSLLKEWREHLA